jgi:hypothetical protein
MVAAAGIDRDAFEGSQGAEFTALWCWRSRRAGGENQANHGREANEFHKFDL